MRTTVNRAAVLLPLLLGACAGTPVEPHEYLLPMPARSLPTSGDAPVRLLPVTIAPYLDQQGIVLQTAGAEVHVARQNRWAEPLDAAVDRYLQVAIANATGRVVEVAPLTTRTAETMVQVRVQQLHGSTDGSVRLAAEWTVSAPTGSAVLHTFEATESQRADGYPALVDAHAALLERLAAAIAGSLDEP
ncbi:MAG: membrane integrity-associated transporter subunit PqiC [Pseudomonadales bacterium]